ncbi:hypothetical protein NP493_784g00000 [Ridgeia piscesae]|uniref:MAM domain-containing protein n=1 Tax=Ridgeia piscesae TaxID=27915 RepID=A0AAD9NLQ2_RIDPI|nr:hypothetical protein NP493_784g00000 [Ridgeia piscesae]
MCNTTVCIPRSKVCDLQKDCLNGEDEDSSLCGNVSEGAACTFEGGLCEWTNHTGSRFHWAWHSGRTPTNNTGPTNDHTTGTPKGHYIYFEASDRQLGDRAMIVSRVYPIPPASTWDPKSPYYHSCQVRFFYHMYGTHVHQLKMHLSEVYIDATPVIRGRFYENYWVKAILGNNRGVDAWLRVAVPIPRVGRRSVTPGVIIIYNCSELKRKFTQN